MGLIETDETNKFTFEAFASHKFYTEVNRSLVRHALALCPRVIFLLRLAFLESQRCSTLLACVRAQKQVAVYAPRRVAGATRVERDSFRLVCVGAWSSRPG